VLRRVADGIRRRGDELAAVESIDVGKPITLSRAVDVNTVVEQYEYHAALAQTLDGAARAIPLPPTRYSDPMLPDDVAADFPGPTIVPAHPSVPWQDEATHR
jgi:predicted TIM-barrel fold metal-dependent hydrolase